jgi:predicted RNA binding protein YcfA (HicA-like mRNA interferase family)
MRPFSGKEFAKIVEKHGWTLRRVHGSHHVCGEADSVVRLSVPIHGNRGLKAGLRAHLAETAGLTEKDFE